MMVGEKNISSGGGKKRKEMYEFYVLSHSLFLFSQIFYFFVNVRTEQKLKKKKYYQSFMSGQRCRPQWRTSTREVLRCVEVDRSEL